ncbi:6-phosphofructokinase [candidate division KSB1 bacterium]|nr:MAG: 6-phosphofructokinase [candidate division KSB1 bacterium]
MNIGVLTGGGDCPGLNAAIRAVTKRGIDEYGYNILGIKNGWDGLVEGNVAPLTLYSVSGILPKGGTILGTSRRNPLKNREDWHKVLDNIRKFELDVIVAIGGEDTLGVALKLYDEGVNVVGIPKTIDNDLQGTDYTFGFDTALYIATEAIDRIHTTAESHHRVMVVEVMGRHTGWIAVMSGIAGGADCILIPEVPFSIEEIVKIILGRKKRGKTFSIVVVAEGAKPKEIKELVTRSNKVDEFGHIYLGGIADVLGKELEKRTNMETRVTILGHIQRGGTPTPFDRILATRFGVKAVDMIKEKQFGKMAALIGSSITTSPIEEAVKEPKKVPVELYEIAKVFFR